MTTERKAVEAQVIRAHSRDCSCGYPDGVLDGWNGAPDVQCSRLRAEILAALDAAQGEAGPSRDVVVFRSGQRIADRCPTCGHTTLFIGSGGWLTCSLIGCKEPGVSRAIELLKAPPVEAGPSREALLTLLATAQVWKERQCKGVAQRVLLTQIDICTRDSEQRPEPPVEAGPKRVHVAQEHDNAWCPGHAVATSECPAPVGAAPAGMEEGR